MKKKSKKLKAQFEHDGIHSKRKLKRLYGKKAIEILMGMNIIQSIEGQEDYVEMFIPPSPSLPSKEEFAKMTSDYEVKKFGKKVEEVLSDAEGNCSDLASEMGDWYDNLPESLQSGNKGDMLQEAQSNLEGISWPEVPECIKDKVILIYPPKMGRRPSRADRLGESISALSDLGEFLDTEKEDEENKFTDEQKDEIQSLIDEIGSVISEMENVEFPGMYS